MPQELQRVENPEELIAGAVTIEDPAEVQRAIMRDIMARETAEELFSGVGNTTSAYDMLEEPFDLVDVRFMQSDYEEGPGAYAFITGATVPDGVELQITCGARNVIAQLYAWKQRAMGGQRLRFVEAGKEKKGRKRPLWLVSVES